MQNTSEEEFEGLAKAIGSIVLLWGQAEQALDLLVAMLWQASSGKSHAKKIPIMLEPKIKFIRACFSTEAKLINEKEKAFILLSRFDGLSKLRHDLIHGAVTSMVPTENSFLFAKLDVKNGFHHHREVRLTAEEYPSMIDKLVSLGGDANKLNELVYKRIEYRGSIIK